MITVTVAGMEQPLEGLSESWLHEQIRRRQKAGESVCVQVGVHTPDINVGVSSGACPAGPGGSRPHGDGRPDESEAAASRPRGGAPGEGWAKKHTGPEVGG